MGWRRRRGLRLGAAAKIRDGRESIMVLADDFFTFSISMGQVISPSIFFIIARLVRGPATAITNDESFSLRPVSSAWLPSVKL